MYYPHNCYCRVLELESSGRRDEIRLHYLHEGQIRTETLPYRLADNRWHLVALGFSSHHCILYIDCNKVRSLVDLSHKRPLWLQTLRTSRRKICIKFYHFTGGVGGSKMNSCLPKTTIWSFSSSGWKGVNRLPLYLKRPFGCFPPWGRRG